MTDEQIQGLRRLFAVATASAADVYFDPPPNEPPVARGATAYIVAMEALPVLLDEIERSRALLRRIEWSGSPDWDPTVRRCCPSCSRQSGHTDDCELAALIGAGPSQICNQAPE